MTENENENKDDIIPEEQALAELLAKQKELESIIAKKKEEKRLRELEIARNKPLVLWAIDFNEYGKQSYITIRPSNPEHPHVKDIFSKFNVHGYTNRFIYVDSWLDFIQHVATFERVSIEYKNNTKEIIAEYLSSWFYQVDKGEKNLIVKWNIKTYPRRELSSIPGANTKGRVFNFPLQEAWRVYNILQDEVTTHQHEVIYTTEALTYILEQVKARDELNTIAQQKVYEPYLQLDLNGHHLKPFQTVGLRFLVLAGGRALIGDEMGLGKTVQALAFYALKKEDGERLSTLVICPAHLVYNWYREIKKYLGQETRINVFRGLVPSELDMVRMIDKSSYDIGIISYNLVGKSHELKGEKFEDEKGYTHQSEDSTVSLWARLIQLTKFDYIIVDEVHYISNSRSGRSQSVRELESKYLCELSGTPLVNRPPDLWPVLHLYDRSKFHSEGNFISNYTLYDKKTPRNVQELREIMRTIMIRRRKVDVITDLPPIERIPYYHELTPKAAKVYAKALLGVYQYIDSLGNQWEKNITNILAKINRLKQICAIDKAGSTTPDLARDIHDQNSEEDYNKVLIFSYFHDTTYKIKTVLSPESISFLKSTESGNLQLVPVPERMNICDKFTNDSNINFLAAPLMSTQEGLNITAAGFCIFNDMWWSPKTHHQAEGRAYGRLSDPHSVTSYYVLAKGTVDEYIYELNEEKQATFDEIIEGVEVDRSESIARRLIEKLREDMEKMKKGEKKNGNGY